MDAVTCAMLLHDIAAHDLVNGVNHFLPFLPHSTIPPDVARLIAEPEHYRASFGSLAGASVGAPLPTWVTQAASSPPWLRAYGLSPPVFFFW